MSVILVGGRQDNLLLFLFGRISRHCWPREDSIVWEKRIAKDPSGLLEACPKNEMQNCYDIRRVHAVVACVLVYENEQQAAVYSSKVIFNALFDIVFERMMVGIAQDYRYNESSDRCSSSCCRAILSLSFLTHETCKTHAHKTT
jgi:hypothetical protein